MKIQIIFIIIFLYCTSILKAQYTPWVTDVRVLGDLTLSTSQDYFAIYDSSALGWKKIKVSSFLTSAIGSTYLPLSGGTMTGALNVLAETFGSGWNGDAGAPRKDDIWDAFTTATFTATVTQSGSDTLLNSATCYGHLTRQGEIVTITVRIEIGLTNTGNTNTVYFDPPIASNFASTASDVIGTANMETQSAVGGNIPQQRCLVFASTADDKIGISFDPVASLTYPSNRQYISASFSYIVQ